MDTRGSHDVYAYVTAGIFLALVLTLLDSKLEILFCTYPTISIVFFHKLAIVVVVKGGVALHTFLFTKLVVLSFRAVHRSVNNLKKNTATNLVFGNMKFHENLSQKLKQRNKTTI